MRSVGTICVSVQYDVRVPVKAPFSNSLLTGAPPPQTEKYSHSALQACDARAGCRGSSADCRQVVVDFAQASGC